MMLRIEEITAVANRNQDAVTAAILALGRIRNEGLTAQEAQSVAHEALLEIQGVLQRG